MSIAESLPAPPEAVAAPGPLTRLASPGAQVALGSALVLALALGPELAGNRYWAGALQLAVVYAAAAVFMAILRVDAGQVSFGQGAIFALAAYAVGMACGLHGLPWTVGALCGIAAALLGGLLFALPALRVQGFYLGFVTLSAAMVVPELLVSANRWTNGVSGIRLSFPELTGTTAIGLSPLALLVALLGIGSLLLYLWLPRTPLGRRMRVAAASPEAARALGTSPGVVRSIAFLLAALGTGLAGVLYPPLVGFVSPNAFHVELSILFFFAVVVGGAGQPLGPLVGIGLLHVVPNVLLAHLAEYRLLIYGAVALAVMLLLPGGMVGTLVAGARRRAAAAAPPLRLDRVLGALRSAVVPVAAASGNAIEVRDARKSFGQVLALDGVELIVARGEIHGLVGANGSGKTSLLNVLSGFSRLDGGSVLIAGRDVTRLAAHRIARLGIGRSFQTPRMFEDLSAWENLAIGIDARHGRPLDPATARLAEDLRRALGGRPIDRVPHGQRRVLEMLRVVLQGADVLLLDEPAAGLSSDERDAFIALLRELRDRLGKTIVIVEHDLSLLWRVVDRVTVLEAGHRVAVGTPDAVRADPAAAHLFLGGSVRGA